MENEKLMKQHTETQGELALPPCSKKCLFISAVLEAAVAAGVIGLLEELYFMLAHLGFSLIGQSLLIGALVGALGYLARRLAIPLVRGQRICAHPAGFLAILMAMGLGIVPFAMVSAFLTFSPGGEPAAMDGAIFFAAGMASVGFGYPFGLMMAEISEKHCR